MCRVESAPRPEARARSPRPDMSRALVISFIYAPGRRISLYPIGIFYCIGSDRSIVFAASAPLFVVQL